MLRLLSRSGRNGAGRIWLAAVDGAAGARSRVWQGNLGQGNGKLMKRGRGGCGMDNPRGARGFLRSAAVCAEHQPQQVGPRGRL